ncbi:hypothetical protein [Geitlerinema sp. PCC 9228]|uniref:hypothetical protein n=1 Tax=Geitlerinema sp. PCC 9228 TaxID=111611 RepID=UPI0008F9CAC7|nr:hypothetical protein [Geitlerinema sp. PCC 9228]
MTPKITDSVAWQQTEQLMQPTLLRVIDNIRKHAETYNWQIKYEAVETPIPGYQLCLQNGQQQCQINLWELCYQICFCNYHLSPLEPSSQEVEVDVDTSLLDDCGEVDWLRLDEKTQRAIADVFAQASHQLHGE